MAIQAELREKVLSSPSLELFKQKAREKRQAAKQQDTQNKTITTCTVL